MQTSIRFTRQGSNSAFGNFASGDVLRCSSALARHLVEEAKVAAYMDAPKVEKTEGAPVEPVAAKPRRKAHKEA